MNTQFARGFIAPLLLIIILIALGGGAYYVIHNTKSFSDEYMPRAPGPSAATTTTDAIADWKTYTDEKYGFEIKYPPAWIQSIRGPNFVLQETNSSKGSISIEAIEGYTGKISDVFTSGVFGKINFKNDCTSISFADTAAYDCPMGSYLGKRAIFVHTDKFPLVINDNISNDISSKIISTFKFTK